MKLNVAVITAAVIAVLGLSTVNVNHHINLPTEILTRDVVITKHFWNVKYPFLHKQTDVQLADEIRSYDSARIVEQALQQAEEGDKIIFHLAGYGGEVNTVLTLVDNVQNSKAVVTMRVEGPVYSGHAYLALSGDELQIETHSYIMLHASSALNVDCDQVTGTDRGVSNVEHCKAMMYADSILMNRLLFSLPYVTPEEKLQILTGHDVYLDSTTINSRMRK